MAEREIGKSNGSQRKLSDSFSFGHNRSGEISLKALPSYPNPPMELRLLPGNQSNLLAGIMGEVDPPARDAAHYSRSASSYTAYADSSLTTSAPPFSSSRQSVHFCII